MFSFFFISDNIYRVYIKDESCNVDNCKQLPFSPLGNPFVTKEKGNGKYVVVMQIGWKIQLIQWSGPTSGR